MNELKQIHKEILHKDYTYYWQMTGENDRLRKYQVLKDIADCIVIVIDCCFCIYLLIMMKNIVVALLEQSGIFFTILTKNELIKTVIYNYFLSAIPVLCIYYFFVFSIICCLDFILDTWLILLVVYSIRKLLLIFNVRVRNMRDYAMGSIKVSYRKDSD